VLFLFLFCVVVVGVTVFGVDLIDGAGDGDFLCLVCSGRFIVVGFVDLILLVAFCLNIEAMVVTISVSNRTWPNVAANWFVVCFLHSKIYLLTVLNN
jgi:hypothetical protein